MWHLCLNKSLGQNWLHWPCTVTHMAFHCVPTSLSSPNIQDNTVIKGNVHKKQYLQKSMEIWYLQFVLLFLLFLSSWCTSSTSRFLPSCTLWAPPSSSSATTETGPGKEARPRGSLWNWVWPVPAQRQRHCQWAPEHERKRTAARLDQ